MRGEERLLSPSRHEARRQSLGRRFVLRTQTRKRLRELPALRMGDPNCHSQGAGSRLRGVARNFGVAADNKGLEDLCLGNTRLRIAPSNSYRLHFEVR